MWIELLVAFAVIVLVYGPIAIACESFIGWASDRTLTQPLLNTLLAIAAGAVLGILSYWLWPHRVVGSGAISGVSVIVLPILAALAVTFTAWRRRRSQLPAHPLLRFWLAFDFAFAAALSRLLLITRVLQ
jgi:site-specific recombinase